MSWHEILPNLGEFINKTGFPVGLWLITGFVVYKLGKKIFVKVEPIIKEVITDETFCTAIIEPSHKGLG
jgi:hypothetical protein